MIKMKNIISFFVSIIIIVVIVLSRDTIVDLFKDALYSNREIVIPETNIYKKDYEFMYFKNTNNYMPKDYDELVQVFYTILNNGWREFSFYCDIDYKDCIEDVDSLSNDKYFLAEMSNYVHPYNQYKSVSTIVNEYFGGSIEVVVTIKPKYSIEDIIKIDSDIDKLMNDNLNDSMSIRDKIKTMHDIIINETKYDKQRADTGDSPYDSARINGLLYENYAVCSAYTDIMAVILSKLGVPNFMVASYGEKDDDGHVWNSLYLDNKWYHLDLTWDDPTTTSGNNVLLHDFFLISDNRLTKLDMDAEVRRHIYNRDIYLEFN